MKKIENKKILRRFRSQTRADLKKERALRRAESREEADRESFMGDGCSASEYLRGGGFS